jgi:penicillin V acylase-like amidase (Ntn superfamily)
LLARRVTQRQTDGGHHVTEIARAVVVRRRDGRRRLCAGRGLRAVYLGSDGVVITGRSMDWMEDMKSNLWAFPAGMKRDGAAGTNTPAWVSKYGSITVSAYDFATTDGMNEAGLVANLLYLAESDYGEPDGSRPHLSISSWAQYVLDNFAEAVEALSAEPFQIVAPVVPDLPLAQLHSSLSDANGDSALFEYIGGKLLIHHGKRYQVMTNSPRFDDQLALNAYWQSIGGLTFLPGTNRAADRFARALIPDQGDSDRGRPRLHQCGARRQLRPTKPSPASWA